MRIRKLDYGTVFEITIREMNSAVDVSNTTTKELIFLKPDGTTKLTKAASLTNDGTDGKIEYTSEENDIDEAGTWQVQAHITTNSGGWYSSIVRFEVDDIL